MLPSNSRLCEQNHGVLRAKDVNNVGMDQADARQFYKNGEEYENREKRRRAEWTNAAGEQQPKRRKHSHTLGQVLMIGHQMKESVMSFISRANNLLTGSNAIPTITRIRERGRRVQDKNNLARHMEAAQVQASRLRREMETAEGLHQEAASLQLQNFASLNQKDEDIIAKQKLLQITKKAHWDSIPTPGSKNKGFRLMKMANHSLRKFGLVVHTRAEINRMESKRWSAKEQKRLEKNPEARQKERPKRGMLTMVDCREPTQISKQNALGLIHLYNKRSVMIAKDTCIYTT
jgi:hypothetical protein